MSSDCSAVYLDRKAFEYCFFYFEEENWQMEEENSLDEIQVPLL